MQLEKLGELARWREKGYSALLVTVWLYANLPALVWLGQSLQSISLLNGLLLSAGISFLLGLMVRSRSQWQFSPTPILQPLPLSLMLAAGVGAIVCPWVVDIPQLPVLLFGLGTYGLCGLFLPNVTWWRGLPIAALVACVLPFGAQFGTGLGFPVRVLTAQIVEQFLQSWQIAAISSHDIIVLENGVARVDLPCSGLKSIWAGILFLLAATWLEGRTIGGRWLLVCVTHSILLLVANTLRVLALVLLIHIQQPQMAEIVHIPLGILGFILACGLTWVLLQWIPKNPVRRLLPVNRLEARSQQLKAKSPTDWVARTILIAAVFSLGILAASYPPRTLPAIAPLQMPSAIQAQPIALIPVEQRFFSNASSTTPQKWRFTFGDLTGSILIVSSRNWSAFHPPELCLIGSGLQVDRMETKQLAPVVLARWLTLEKGRLTATYWLQSRHHTTDDFLSRMGEYVLHQNRTWVMVSILLNDDRPPDDPKLQEFVTLIHTTIDHHLQGHSL
ncbi:MAG: exosortase O [Scytolyngbya sp. HA4215-MV1]|nr:exosortase O [Scytolyngbya sp. HA4215-MV1]